MQLWGWDNKFDITCYADGTELILLDLRTKSINETKSMQILHSVTTDYACNFSLLCATYMCFLKIKTLFQ